MENVIDVSKVNNCWLVRILPFWLEDKVNNEFVIKYQQNCMKNGIFGMGWSDDKKTGELKRLFNNRTIKENIDKKEIKEFIKLEKLYRNMEQSDFIDMADLYETKMRELEMKNKDKGNEGEKSEDDEEIEKQNSGALRRALNAYKNIQKDDIVMTRLRNGRYYIGRVSSEEAFYNKGEDQEILKGYNSQGFSWCCSVYKWYSLSEEQVPTDIVGRFSQRRQPTIQRAGDDRIRLLMIKMYEQQENADSEFPVEKLKIDIPAIQLNEYNFARALNYMELEDLVYLYMIEKNKNYSLLPSQCKISEIKYEFFLLDKEKNKITCQVKNREEVRYNDYKNEVRDSKDSKLKKIYLFSGIEEYGKYEKEDGVEIIQRDKLYKILKESDFFKDKFENGYYEITNKNFKSVEEIEAPNEEWRENENFRGNEKRYRKKYYKDKKGTPGICFNTKARIYYNDEFKSFIVSDQNGEYTKEIQRIIEEWSKVIF